MNRYCKKHWDNKSNTSLELKYLRCNNCHEVIDICRCDNDPMEYTLQSNEFNELMYSLDNMQIQETPYVEDITDDFMDIEY